VEAGREAVAEPRLRLGTAKFYADFQNLEEDNRFRLTRAGTVEDLSRQGIRLRGGQVLTFDIDDADDRSRPDELRVDGTVQYNEGEECWVVRVIWTTLRHASDERSPRIGQPAASE
jgi:hypothetical protein